MGLSNLLLLFALSAIWGASFMFIKIAVQEVAPLFLVALRVGLGAAGLVVFAVATGLRFPPLTGVTSGRPVWASCLLLAFFGAVLPYSLINWGELHITSGAAAILNATSPLFSAVFSYKLGLWGKEEELTGGRAAGLALGVVGVAVLVGGSESAQLIGEGGGLLELGGYLALLGASASYAVGALSARLAFAGQPPLVPALAQNIGGLLLVAPFAVLLAWPSAIPSPLAVGAVLALGLVGTAFAYIIYYHLLGKVGATRTLSVTYLLPLTALVYSALLLKEPLPLSMLAGLALILAGVALTTGTVRLPVRAR